MPPFFGQAHVHSALQNEAVPVLEQLAANDNLRDRVLNRFERDDPPPYVSSTESEEFEDEFPIRRSDGWLSEEAIAIMDPPLTDDEIRLLSKKIQLTTSPASAYRKEAGYEHRRLREYRPFLINPLFWGKNSDRRTGVLIRHFIKRRWEKLGVWNPEWGIPVRNKQPNDDIDEWRWRWEQDDTGSPGSEAGYSLHGGRLLVQRLLQLRQNLRRGETSPVVPRSRLAQDATASEAESFIISRPWVTFRVEWGEENTRRERAWAADLIDLIQYIPLKQVIEWWKERGDWREKFDIEERKTLVGSWKWRHESPSPEPEDVTPIDNMKDSLLDARDMEFTPSEIDALEAIPPPGYLSPVAPVAAGEKLGIFVDPSHPKGLFGPWTPEEAPTEDHEDISQEAEGQLLEQEQEVKEQPLEQRRNGSSAPSQNTRFQPRRQRLRDKGRNTVQDQDQEQDQPPPLRRSARIAGVKRSIESLPSEFVPNKKRKGKAISRAATLKTKPVTRETQRRKSTQPAAAISGPNETRPRRGRGGSRKENRPGIAVTTEMRAPARRGGKGMAMDSPAVPRRRRRTGGGQGRMNDVD